MNVQAQRASLGALRSARKMGRRRAAPRFVLAAATVLAGCVVETDLPPDTVLKCGASAACPDDQICQNGQCVGETQETRPTFADVRVTPLRPEPGQRLKVRPTGFRPVEGTRTRFQPRWLDAQGRPHVAGDDWTFLPTATQAAGPIRAQIDLIEEDSGRVLQTLTSCERSVALPEAGFVADRPRRGRPDDPALHEGEPPPRAVLDPARERIVLLVVGADGVADYWEFDTSDPAAADPVPAQDAVDTHRWRSLLRSTSSDLTGSALVTLDAGAGFAALAAGDSDGATIGADRGCEVETPGAWAHLPQGLAPNPRVIVDPAVPGRWLAWGELAEGGSTGVFTRAATATEADWTRLDAEEGPDGRPGAGTLVTAIEGAEAMFALSPDGEGFQLWKLETSDAFPVWAAIGTQDAPHEVSPQAVSVFPHGNQLLAWSGCIADDCEVRTTTLHLLRLSDWPAHWVTATLEGPALPAGRVTLLPDVVNDRILAVSTPFQGGPSVHALRLVPESNTILVTDLDPHPLPLYLQGGAWDGTRLAVFGGYSGRSDLPGTEAFVGNTTWLWEDGRWSIGLGRGFAPSWRTGPLLLPVGQARFLMFGGQIDEVAASNDLWLLKTGAEITWTRLGGSAAADWPSPRGYTHGVALPAERGAASAWLFAGAALGASLGDGFEVSVDSTGTQVTWVPEAGPPGRTHAAVAVDPQADRLLLLGGLAAPFDTETPLSEAWVSTSRPRAWRAVPLPEQVGLVADASLATLAQDRYLLWGGTGQQGRMQVLCFDAAADAFSRVVDLPWVDPGLGHCGHEGATVALDPITDSLVFFGGGREIDCDAVWRYRGAASLAALCD